MERFISEMAGHGPKRQMFPTLKEMRPRHFLEGDHSAGTDKLAKRAQDRHGVGKKLQNEAAHDRIERCSGLDLGRIALHEAHVVETGVGDANSGARNRVRVAFYPYHFTRRTNQPGRQHGHVSGAGAEVEDSLPPTDAGFAEELLGDWRQIRSLPDEALVFKVRAAEDVGRSGASCRHTASPLSLTPAASVAEPRSARQT